MARVSDDHRQRLDRTLSFIDEHLGEPLDLAALAGAACFSKFHFHRVFKAAMGMSPQEYLTGRRLERAYHFLALAPDLPVAEIAIVLGFSSSSNFSRAFRKRFGFRPRDLRTPAADPFRDAWTPQGAPPFTAIDPAAVRLAVVPPFRVLYRRMRGQPTDATVERTLGALREERARLGFDFDGARELILTRSTMPVTGPEEAVFDYAVEVAPDAPEGDPAHVQRIPGGNYACYEYRGPPAEVSRCWDELHGLWLRRAGVSVGEAFPMTEVPRGGYALADDRWLRLFLPLRGRSAAHAG